MNVGTIAIGLLAIVYGLYTLVLRKKAPEKFGKLVAMQRAWGEKPGLILHWVGYTLVPILVGISFVVTGMHGGSFVGP